MTSFESVELTLNAKVNRAGFNRRLDHEGVHAHLPISSAVVAIRYLEEHLVVYFISKLQRVLLKEDTRDFLLLNCKFCTF